MSESCTVITGAASGIGYAVASQVLAAGERVVAVDMNADRLAERFAANELVLQVACDLTSPEGLNMLTSAIKGADLQVKGFVHAAGIDVVAPLGMIKPEDVQRLVAIHAGFPIQFLGWLGKKNNHAPQASCVLISSLSASEGAKGHVGYAAAKGAVEGMLKAAAAELVAKGVRLNAVILGVVETEMARGWMSKLTPEQLQAITREYPLGLGEPAAVADAITFLLSPRSRWITGQTLICDGGHSLV